MVFNGIKASLRPILMKSFAEIVAGDAVVERKLSASSLLAMMFLAVVFCFRLKIGIPADVRDMFGRYDKRQRRIPRECPFEFGEL
jgi:hypothetical protein